VTGRTTGSEGQELMCRERPGLRVDNKNTIYWGKSFPKSNKAQKGAGRGSEVHAGRSEQAEYSVSTLKTRLQTKDNNPARDKGKTRTIYRGGNRCTTWDSNKTRVAESRWRGWNNQGDTEETLRRALQKVNHKIFCVGHRSENLGSIHLVDEVSFNCNLFVSVNMNQADMSVGEKWYYWTN